jgi:HD-GYP domain-containing protein (c-di-GMP phosphodiesterase class II)
VTALAPAQPGKDYSLYRIDKILDNSSTDFDLFIALEKHFILYSGNGYRWSKDELNGLLQAGHENLFIRNDDLSKARMYEAVSVLPAISKDLAPPDRIQKIEQIGAQFIKCLHEGELTESTVTKAESIADTMVDCVSEEVGCVKFLSGLADHDYYTYYHSIRVASYAVAVALNMGVTDKDQLHNIALGGIFHDIGKKEIPLSVLNKAGALTPTEWKQMRSHPEEGHRQIGESILALVPREIILHHHEKRNGSGYPHGLDKGSLIQEVQIATLADIFDALTSSRSYQTRRTKYEALDFIKHKMLKEDVCPDAFKALVLALAT